MTLFKNNYRIESTRLRGWDYRTPGYYFVTICTKNREPYFGQIIQGEMHLSSMGEIAAQCWRETPKHHANVDLDEFMIMPNHTRGIVVIYNLVGIKNVRNFTESRSSGAIIRSYKSTATRLCGLQGFTEFAWQMRYHDHLIRNENSLLRIRQSIRNNPAKWELDKENPSKF